MSETREEVIRRHWKRRGYHWSIKEIGHVLNIPEEHHLSPFVGMDAEPDEPMIRKLSYRFEIGRIDGDPAYRIVCEGVVVEEGRF